VALEPSRSFFRTFDGVSGSACPSRTLSGGRAGTRSRNDDPQGSIEPTSPQEEAPRLLDSDATRLQIDSDDEDDIFADPKITTPGLQTCGIVSPALANLNRLDDAGEEEQDDTPMHNQDQEEELEEPESPEATEDPPVLASRKNPPAIGQMNVTTEPASSLSRSQPLPNLASLSLSLSQKVQSHTFSNSPKMTSSELFVRCSIRITIDLLSLMVSSASSFLKCSSMERGSHCTTHSFLPF
jgi:hypothetical protein